MMIPTIFVSRLQKTKHKASNQHNEGNKYISKRNKYFFYNLMPKRAWHYSLNSIRKRTKFIISIQL